jgi:uncharacterized membrane protein
MFWSSLKSLFKKYFIAGTIVLVPVAGTVWILKTIIIWADGFFMSLLPEAIQPRHKIPGVGLVITIAAILTVGIFTRLYLGKKLFALGDKLISAIPFGRAIYNALKQILATAFADKEDRFKGVCLVEYPKAGTYAMAFITNDASVDTPKSDGKKYLRVFVPTTPNPTSGFLLILPEDEVKMLDLSIEQASKMIISGGLLDG